MKKHYETPTMTTYVLNAGSFLETSGEQGDYFTKDIFTGEYGKEFEN